jgi:hypothetical protein
VGATVARYGDWDWRAGADVLGPHITSFAVSDKKPKYAKASNAAGPWVAAYRIEDPATGEALVYAPFLWTWPPGFDEFVAGAERVLLDGTFFLVRGDGRHGHGGVAGDGSCADRRGGRQPRPHQAARVHRMAVPT